MNPFNVKQIIDERNAALGMVRTVETLNAELEEKLTSAIEHVKAAQAENAGLQESHLIGSPVWHRHETIDDRLHDTLTALGD